MSFPLVYSVQQIFDQPIVEDVAGETRLQILGSRLKERLQPDAGVAVAVGSRGIANIGVIADSAIKTLREMGFRPFVVAAMGSHGGATSEGQREILTGYGVPEEKLGVPVKTDMDTVDLGPNSWGESVYWDKNAYEADAVVTLSRIKPHTDFKGRHESGIVKMLVIGLGKRDGAAQHHQYGMRGLRDMIPESVAVVLEKTRFALGLAIVENANDETAIIQAVEKEDVLKVEPELLEKARSLMGRLPFDELDLLIIGETGKNYSGTGMDVNVLGRRMVEGEGENPDPKITRICVLDLAPESHGNATGVGIADLTTAKLLHKTNREATRMNLLTSRFMLRSRTPIDMANDRECIEEGLKTCWQPNRDKVRMAIIPNTLELNQIWVTRPLVDTVNGNGNLRVETAARELPFDGEQNLIQEDLFAASVRGRRAK